MSGLVPHVDHTAPDLVYADSVEARHTPWVKSGLRQQLRFRS
jgi:hypothetical protein